MEGSIPGLGRSPRGQHATHSSVLAWRIPWTEEPGGLQSTESQFSTHARGWGQISTPSEEDRSHSQSCVQMPVCVC